jgi:hypothetical protein
LSTQTRIEISSQFRVPVILMGTFVLAGAVSPTSIGGDLQSVTRLLTTAGPRPFYRLRFRRRFPVLTHLNSVITYSVQCAENASPTVNVSRAGFVTPSGALVTSREIDLQVLLGGVVVDTANIVVGVQLMFDAGKR